MKLIKFNCILVLIWENCKIIHLGNSTHRSTDILLSPQPAAALRITYLKGSRSQQWRVDLVCAPRLQLPLSNLVAVSMTQGTGQSLSPQSLIRLHMVVSEWDDLTSARANNWLLIALKKEVATRPVHSQDGTPAKSVQNQSCLAIWVYFPKFCHKMICFLKSLVLSEFCISDVDIFYIWI